MDFNIKAIALITTTILTGLSAGIFYAWAMTVIPGTKKVTDFVYVETMQNINREILNPGFFIVFFGALFLQIGSVFILGTNQKPSSTFYFVLAAVLVYFIGTILVTMFGNVPLNNQLAKLDLTQLSEQGFKQARNSFEAKWNSLNLVRTIAALLSFILLIFALYKK